MFHRTDDGKLLYIGGRFVPHMDTLTEGFTLLKMVPRVNVAGAGTPEAPAGRTSTSPPTYSSVWDGPGSDVPLQCDNGSGGDEEELLLASRTESGSRTAVMVKLQGDMDITVTPLLLECLQRFVDALTPTLSSQHPLNVVTHLHASCVSQVEGANTLKKDQDVASRIGGSTVVRTASMTRTAPALTAGGTYEEHVHTQVQMAVVLPKVNITLLQASVVEEIISFSALDNIRDFTCVSLFTVCFDNVTARFHRGRQAREVVQIFHRPAVLQSGGKKGTSAGSGSGGSSSGGGASSMVKGPKAFLMSHPAVTHADTIAGEPVYIETSEKQQEETVVSLNIGKVHAQLRRLRNECSILNDAVITAIPVQHSKVLFTCTKMSSRMRGLEYYMIPAPMTGNSDAAAEDFNTEDKLGFIMFECGLEGVCVKVVKRSQFEKIENSQEEPAAAATTTVISSSGGGGGGKISETEVYGTESVRSRDDIDSVDRQSEASTQTTVTSQRVNREPQTTAAGSAAEPPPSASQKDTASAAGAVVTAAAKDSGNISSCVIDLKTVWFNFAAPPRAPITRKLDYTRLDWNLLSTASPAINAWMNPSNRFAIRIVHMFRTMYRRSTGVVACLMAEALDVQGIHMPAKVQYIHLLW